MSQLLGKTISLKRVSHDGDAFKGDRSLREEEKDSFGDGTV